MNEEIIDLLRCPICRSALALRDRSLICANRHCYDVARQGHVNFVPNQRGSFYTKALFESRAAVFAAGVFEPVIAALSETIDALVPGEMPVLLDAGCGEGYYAKAVCPGRRMLRIGLDLSKEAVRLAARGQSEASFFVADLKHIPLADHRCDVLLDVFTPADYAEFGRVLREDGVLIKLAPRSGYLHELREAAADQLRRKAYDGSDVERYVHERMHVLTRRTITYTVDVTPELALHMARMTPMLAGVDLNRLDLSGVTRITVDETLYAGTVKQHHQPASGGEAI